MVDELNPTTQLYEPAQETAPEPVKAPQESEKERNLRILGKRAEDAERRAADLERMLNMKMAENQTPNKPVMVEEDDDFDVPDDNFIEGRQVKKVIRKLKNEVREAKQQFREFQQQSSVSNAEVRLKSEFTDFNSVVSKENLERLASVKPSLYRSIMANQDIYDRGYAAYEMIKNGGIAMETYPDADRRIEENRAKPRSAATAPSQSSDSPLARVGDYDRRTLSEAQKDENMRRVYEAKKFR
jgi:hypothetical protein